jgi:CRISPR-associated protein Cmr1
MPEELLARYRIVTPMFLGGADQRCDGSLRAPSVKGALRFWWRALNWPRFRAGADDTQALRQLHAEEGRLFGLAANEVDKQQTGGQGGFLMTVRPLCSGRLSVHKKGEVHQSFREVEAARYLGYGLMVAFPGKDKFGQFHEKGELLRDCVSSDQQFEVRLRFRDQVEPSVVNALKALGLLGGLGGRARHGMGCIALESLNQSGAEIFTAPTNREGYSAAVRDLVGATPATLNPFKSIADEPPFTAFWRDSRIDDLVGVKDDPYAALDAFALAMMRYRSWGQSIKGNVLPGGSVSEKRFQDDHDWFRVNGWRSAHKSFHPERAVFGLPHNYGPNAKDHVTAASFERRASALLLHVHPVGDQFLGVTTFLPARFLPPGERINAGGISVPVATDWRLIADLLDGKVGSSLVPTAPDRFPGKRSIL